MLSLLSPQRLPFRHSTVVSTSLANAHSYCNTAAARSHPAGSPGQTRIKRAESEPLSVAQLRVYRLLVDGLSEKRIASRLQISPCTVHNHIGAIYLAFGVHSRAELLVRALSGKAPT